MADILATISNTSSVLGSAYGGDSIITLEQLSNTPVEFAGSVNAVEISSASNYQLSSLTDDTITLALSITSGGVVLAAANAVGTRQVVAGPFSSSGDNGAGKSFGAVSFAYVNAAATKAQWDSARVECQQSYSSNMSNDGAYFSIATGDLEFELSSPNRVVVGDTESLTLTANAATVSKLFTAPLDFTGATSGDTLLAFIAASTYNAAIVPPAGWTFVGDVYNASTPDQKVACYKKVADGTETTIHFGCVVACTGIPEIISGTIYDDIVQGTETENYGGPVGGIYSKGTSSIDDKSRYYAFGMLQEDDEADPLPEFLIPENETIVGEVESGPLTAALTYRVIDYFGVGKVWQHAGTLASSDSNNWSVGDAADSLIKGGSGSSRGTFQWDGTTITFVGNSIVSFRNRQPAGTSSAAAIFCGVTTGYNKAEEWDGAAWANVTVVPVAGSAACFAGGTQTDALLLPHTTGAEYAYTYNGSSYTAGTAASNNHYGGCFAGSPAEGLLAGPTNQDLVYVGTEEWDGTSWSAGDNMPPCGFGYLTGRLLGGVGDAVHTGSGVNGYLLAVDHDYDGVAWAVSRSNAYVVVDGAACGSTSSGSGLASGGSGLPLDSGSSSVRILDDPPASVIDSGVTSFQIVPSVSAGGTMITVVVPFVSDAIVRPDPDTLSFSGVAPTVKTVPITYHERVVDPSWGRITILADAGIFDNTQAGGLENIVSGDTAFLTLTGNPAILPVVAPTEFLTLTGNPAVVDQRFRRDVAGDTESLTLTGNPATVQKIAETNRFVVGDTAVLTLTGNPATVDQDRIIVGETESLTLTGNRPTIPVVGVTESLTLTGNPATVDQDRIIAGDTESLTLTGNPATLTKDLTLVLTTESLTLTGTPATVRQSRLVQGATESLALTANPATVVRIISGTTAVLTLTGKPATVDQDRIVQLSTEALALTSNPATVGQGQTVRGDTATLTLTGTPATIGQGQTARGETAELLLISAAATVGQGRTVRPNTEILRLSGRPAFVDQGREVRGDTGKLVLTAYASVFKQRRVTLPSEFLVLAANTAAIGRGRTVRCGTHTLLLAGSPTRVGRGRTVRPATAENLLTGNAASIEQLIRGEIFGDTAYLMLTGNPAHIQRMTILNPLPRYSRVGVLVLPAGIGSNPLPAHKDGVNVISTLGAEKAPATTDVYVREK